jgi:hypothetical protein
LETVTGGGGGGSPERFAQAGLATGTCREHYIFNKAVSKGHV